MGQVLQWKEAVYITKRKVSMGVLYWCPLSTHQDSRQQKKIILWRFSWWVSFLGMHRITVRTWICTFLFSLRNSLCEVHTLDILLSSWISAGISLQVLRPLTINEETVLLQELLFLMNYASSYAMEGIPGLWKTQMPELTCANSDFSKIWITIPELLSSAAAIEPSFPDSGLPILIARFPLQDVVLLQLQRTVC